MILWSRRWFVREDREGESMTWQHHQVSFFQSQGNLPLGVVSRKQISFLEFEFFANEIVSLFLLFVGAAYDDERYKIFFVVTIPTALFEWQSLRDASFLISF
jgi:hypothetical protein